jgi:hypothetical protein
MTAAAQTDPGVSIAIARDPALVRTVRLVAAAVARRADCEDSLIEEIRLAVGEACAVMIGADEPLEQSAGRVEVGIKAGETFVVTVSGHVDQPDSDIESMGLEPWALLRGLCDDLSVSSNGSGTVLAMSWPL